jgi:hypothetical protein
LPSAEQRLAFGKILSNSLVDAFSLAAEPLLLDHVAAVEEKVKVKPSCIVAVLSMRVWT